eukprot:SM000175S03324  [mRNA]  locus=s175:275239:281097:- [translate_table: standard]
MWGFESATSGAAQVGSGGPGLLWKLYRATPKSRAQATVAAEACVWILDKRTLADDRARRGTSKDAEEALLEVFRRDGAALSRLRHPGVVRVVEALDESRGAMAMVTEPVFASLANALGDFANLPRPPPDLDALELGPLEVKHGLLQLAESLAFLHNNARLVHRAVSPETVFITTSGAWKFGGLGFSVFLDKEPPPAPHSEPPFHYPDFDVDGPALPLQPPLDYTAPELSQPPSLAAAAAVPSLLGLDVDQAAAGLADPRTAADVWSLACVAYLLVSKQALVSCNNNLRKHASRVQQVQREPLQAPPDLASDLKAALSPTAGTRPSAQDFGAASFFRDDARLRALRFLDHILERDNLQKTEFLKALSDMWSTFDARVLRFKVAVLPPLLGELRNEAMQQLLLPMILAIAESQSAKDFEETTQPALLPVFQTASGETLLLLLKHLPSLVGKVTLAAQASHVIPMLIRAYDDQDPRIQEEILRRTVAITQKLDTQVLKQAVLPRVHALALKTSMAAVRAQALICLGDLLPGLDKPAVMDVLQTLHRCAGVDKSAATLMCVYRVSDVIVKQHGVEFATEHVLPLVTPLLIVQQLSMQQFAKLLKLVLDVLKEVEKRRGVGPDGAASFPDEKTPLPKINGHAAAPSLGLEARPGRASWDTDNWGPAAAAPVAAAPVTAAASPAPAVSSMAGNDFAWPPPAASSPSSISSFSRQPAVPPASSVFPPLSSSGQVSLGALDGFHGRPDKISSASSSEAPGLLFSSHHSAMASSATPSGFSGNGKPALSDAAGAPDDDDPFADWPPKPASAPSTRLHQPTSLVGGRPSQGPASTDLGLRLLPPAASMPAAAALSPVALGDWTLGGPSMAPSSVSSTASFSPGGMGTPSMSTLPHPSAGPDLGDFFAAPAEAASQPATAAGSGSFRLQPPPAQAGGVQRAPRKIMGRGRGRGSGGGSSPSPTPPLNLL